MKPQFGRRFSPDPNDHKFLLRRKLALPGTPTPTSKTWAITSKALDQGDTGTCVAHAWCNFLRCAPIQTTQGIDALRWKIYDAAIQLDEWPDNDNDTDRQMGTSVRGGAQAVTNLGRLKSYLWAFDLQSALEWVLTKGPVVLGTNWYSSMRNVSKEGIVKITAGASIVGGHSYLWRGANKTRGLALCSNSWGDDWGKSGEFYLSFHDMERLIHEDGEAATAIEQRVAAVK